MLNHERIKQHAPRTSYLQTLVGIFFLVHVKCLRKHVSLQRLRLNSWRTLYKYSQHKYLSAAECWTLGKSHYCLVCVCRCWWAGNTVCGGFLEERSCLPPKPMLLERWHKAEGSCCRFGWILCGFITTNNPSSVTLLSRSDENMNFQFLVTWKKDAECDLLKTSREYDFLTAGLCLH